MWNIVSVSCCIIFMCLSTCILSVCYCDMNCVLCDVFYVVAWLVFMFRVCVVFAFVCMCERGIWA